MGPGPAHPAGGGPRWSLCRAVPGPSRRQAGLYRTGRCLTRLRRGGGSRSKLAKRDAILGAERLGRLGSWAGCPRHAGVGAGRRGEGWESAECRVRSGVVVGIGVGIKIRIIGFVEGGEVGGAEVADFMAEVEIDADEFVAVNPGEVAFGDGGFDVGLAWSKPRAPAA